MTQFKFQGKIQRGRVGQRLWRREEHPLASGPQAVFS